MGTTAQLHHSPGGPAAWLLCQLILDGVVADLFRWRSPSINQGWGGSASVLTRQARTTQFWYTGFFVLSAVQSFMWICLINTVRASDFVSQDDDDGSSNVVVFPLSGAGHFFFVLFFLLQVGAK